MGSVDRYGNMGIEYEWVRKYFDKKDELSKLQTDTKKFLAWMKERAAKQGNERFSR